MQTRTPGTLVVGAGQAGLSLIARLRDLGDEQPITLVGEEPDSPYERPPLSKTYLRGEADQASMTLQPPSWFTESSVELVTGDGVVEISRDATGGVARTASGRDLEFTRLAFTTGAANRRLTLPGADLEGVVSLRTRAEADAISGALTRASDVVVIGGGFIGLEIAASARALGCRVTVVELTEVLLGRAVTPSLSHFYREAHERRGTRVMLATGLARLVGHDGHIAQVELTDGTRLPADLVVVGIGALPRTELAVALDLEVEGRGIVVDRHARASDGLTVAAGDCTIGPNPYARGLVGLMRLESVSHAIDQARTAAATLMGEPAPYDTVPWFWSDQGELRLQIVGLSMGADQTVVRGDPDSEAFSVLSFRHGVLIAAECVGCVPDYVAAKRGLERGMTVDAAVAGDPSTPLKRLLIPA